MQLTQFSVNDLSHCINSNDEITGSNINIRCLELQDKLIDNENITLNLMTIHHEILHTQQDYIPRHSNELNNEVDATLKNESMVLQLEISNLRRKLEKIQCKYNNLESNQESEAINSELTNAQKEMQFIEEKYAKLEETQAILDCKDRISDLSLNEEEQLGENDFPHVKRIRRLKKVNNSFFQTDASDEFIMEKLNEKEERTNNSTICQNLSKSEKIHPSKNVNFFENLCDNKKFENTDLEQEDVCMKEREPSNINQTNIYNLSREIRENGRPPEFKLLLSKKEVGNSLANYKDIQQICTNSKQQLQQTIETLIYEFKEFNSKHDCILENIKSISSNLEELIENLCDLNKRINSSPNILVLLSEFKASIDNEKDFFSKDFHTNFINLKGILKNLQMKNAEFTKYQNELEVENEKLVSCLIKIKLDLNDYETELQKLLEVFNTMKSTKVTSQQSLDDTVKCRQSGKRDIENPFQTENIFRKKWDTMLSEAELNSMQISMPSSSSIQLRRSRTTLNLLENDKSSVVQKKRKYHRFTVHDENRHHLAKFLPSMYIKDSTTEM